VRCKLQKLTADLGIKYNKDINVTEIVEEKIYFKHAALSVYFTTYKFRIIFVFEFTTNDS